MFQSGMHHALHHFPWSFIMGLLSRVMPYTFVSSTVSYPVDCLCLIDKHMCFQFMHLVTSAVSQNKLLMYVSVLEWFVLLESLN